MKVLPLHEVERAAAVEMIRYGYPFAGVHRIFDLTVRFANRASDPWGRFLGRIVKHSEEVAVGANAMSWVVSANMPNMSWVVSANFLRLFVTFLVTQEES